MSDKQPGDSSGPIGSTWSPFATPGPDQAQPVVRTPPTSTGRGRSGRPAADQPDAPHLTELGVFCLDLLRKKKYASGRSLEGFIFSIAGHIVNARNLRNRAISEAEFSQLTAGITRMWGVTSRWLENWLKLATNELTLPEGSLQRGDVVEILKEHLGIKDDGTPARKLVLPEPTKQG